MSKATIKLPAAFSVRDQHEFDAHGHLVRRLNDKLRIKQVATGTHVNGGPTVYWGLVHLAGEDPSEDDIKAALTEAGFDAKHNGAHYSVEY